LIFRPPSPAALMIVARRQVRMCRFRFPWVMPWCRGRVSLSANDDKCTRPLKTILLPLAATLPRLKLFQERLSTPICSARIRIQHPNLQQTKSSVSPASAAVPQPPTPTSSFHRLPTNNRPLAYDNSPIKIYTPRVSICSVRLGATYYTCA
jgi:hypothetical protein